ncbi:glycerophosphodiester phosphodiesterase [Streptacidiphilus rugosus]|uniref:glycerophosphodiester phosphodiesterase n=1 Tax=Streptacidiphilus rugosus TaxID=405783 RepID=UPI00068BFD36|nr:glycerophosphodiester phosphodiesterase [Streptacidiphilus rugosus]
MVTEDPALERGGRPPGTAARGRTLVVGHRGAPLLARENTLPSLDAALRLGVDWIEVDVRLARCGTPVLLHDATLLRLWGDPRAVAALSAAELEQLPGGQRVPTLREGLELAGEFGATVMVDVPAVAEGLVALESVRELGVLDTSVFAGNGEALARIRAAEPAARIALSRESPLPPGPRLLELIRPEYLNVEHHRLTRPLVAWARRRGLGVSVWTVDRAARMSRLAAMGADVIITNDPATALAAAASRAS